MNTIQLRDELDPRDAWVADRCPMARALEVVSTRSAFLILREAFYGATRFDQFVSRTQISEPVAASRLRELTAEGVLSRHPYREPGQRTRDEYLLTDKGSELLPALVALFDWGNRWAIDHDPRVVIRHAGCGADVEARLVCTEGHEVVAGELELAPRRHDD